MDETGQDAPARRRPGRPRKAVAGDTKEELTRAAVRLFARHGFAGTSIRAIARQVGLSESVLYAHFKNKQAIFDAAMARYGPQSSTGVLDAVDSGLAETDPPRFLTELVGGFLEDWDREESRLLISLVARDGLLHSGALRVALAGMRDYAAGLFAGWLAAEWIPEHLGPADRLAFSFTGPIGLARVLHLHAEAGPAERAQARADVLQHVELFTQAVFYTDRKENT
ncbi:helix-turn-helix domain-containing protein [Brevibacterium picturae]|uniref:HTH tetR-type domain-containing protein n=1 Tax=Brevibacterium picturae TaxID=260553 RepID=A0ABP4LS21_9MICO